MTTSIGSSVPDAAVLAAVLRSRRRWCWKQRLIACYVSKHKNRPVEVRRKPRNFHRNRGFAVEEMDCLDPSTFKRMFWVDRSTFDELLDLITLHDVRDGDQWVVYDNTRDDDIFLYGRALGDK